MFADQRLHLIPDLRITFNLDVSLHDNPVVPGISRAVVWSRLIAESKITEDLRAGRIGGANYRCAVKKAVHLIKIRRLGDIRGNKSVGLADFFDAVHLNCEKYGDAVFFQTPRERDTFRGAPAMPVNDDSGAELFVVGKSSIVIRVQNR